MLSTLSPGVLAITCLGNHIIVLLIDKSPAVILCQYVRSKVLSPSTSGMLIACGRIGCDSGMVIPVLYVVALPTTYPLRLLRVPPRLVTLDFEVDFQ